MPDPLDGYLYFAHLRARWRLPALLTAAALVVSLVGSLLIPKKYTARVKLIIETPAGSDPRVSMAVSPVYLESLKTYEALASSDELFARAAERFGLRRLYPGRPIEALKRSVLEVAIPRNTKLLEIAVTLPEARQAHAMATHLAEETMQLNRRTNRAVDDELIAEVRKRTEEARQRLEAARAAHRRSLERAPTLDGLRADLEQLRVTREEVARRLVAGEDERLRRQAAELDGRIASQQDLLVRRSTEVEQLRAEEEGALNVHDEAERQLRGVETAAGARGERLMLLDRGVAPERPSSPNIPLNVLAALALALVVSLLYLTVEFGLQAQKADLSRRHLRVASKP